MHRSDNFPEPFHLNHWLVQPSLNRIVGPDGEVGVEPRVMKVLLVLVDRPGEVIHRNDLLDEVWGDAVVGEEILTRAISELRRVFGDRARHPEYIETIRQHGYRLIAPVTPAEPDELETASPAPAEPGPEPGPEPIRQATPEPSREPEPSPPPPTGGGRARGVPRSVFLLGACLLLIGVVFAPRFYRALRDGATPAPAMPPSAQAIPLTSFPGRELHPALPADGARVAFVWSGPDGDNADLYVKQRNSETPLRLTDDPGWVAWPVWSPDGQTLAFVQGADSGSVLCLIPSLGGAVREVHREPGWIEGLDWSPDGRRLVFSAGGPAGTSHDLWFLSLDDFRTVAFAPDGEDHTGRYQPRFSPDGKALAWIATGPDGSTRLETAPVEGGRVRRLVAGPAAMQGLAWTSDGAHLVYAAAPDDRFTLWQVPSAGGTPRWISTPGDFAWNPAIARESGDLVFEQVRMDQDIWRVRILGRSPWQLGSGPFLTSTRWESEADFHPSGDRVVFVSSRSGHAELWLSTAEGTDPRQVTALRGASLTNPRWSPAGDEIAFNAVTDGQSRILIVQALGGTAREADAGVDGPAVFTAWSADGANLLVGGDFGGGWQIHRLDPRDGGTRALTRRGGLTAAEEPGGGALWFTRPGTAGLWRLPLEEGVPAGDPTLMVADLDPRDARNWRLQASGGRVTEVIHVSRMGGEAFLTLHDLATGTSSFLTDLPGLAASGLAVSPDRNVILFARTEDQAGDLMLIRPVTP